MAVFRYSVTLKTREDFTEEGVVAAKNEEEARHKLYQLDLRGAQLKEMKGVKAWFKWFSADIR